MKRFKQEENLTIKDLIKFSLVTILVFILIGIMIFLDLKSHSTELEIKVAEVEEPVLTEWQIYQLATIKVESEFNFLAKGKSKDYGIFQITPIYVKEVNRILGKEIYSHEDAFDIQKSFQMFEVYQTYYNSEKSIPKAIKVHNPKGERIGYPDKIYQAMDWVRMNIDTIKLENQTIYSYIIQI